MTNHLDIFMSGKNLWLNGLMMIFTVFIWYNKQEKASHSHNINHAGGSEADAGY